ncbi:aminoglycoside phosphotransferase family protein [Actinospica sp. MGRD01-02]|uniref:Aminoglycoside phosphotransferase family protein n=1 Tax=Actinospica acidithermotolerans TaxID=2828514 RepID=A0A941EHN5_9ACTN|nr:aminoglycoside phosphotransferase family protein [Actinospica acidithermotolerans]MBR7827824.1 aminoglycoside phosphotransferase family protein [Actinospica acidithermotolerans]
MLSTTEHGPFSRARLARSLAAACEHANLDPSGAKLIHTTVNATFQTRQPEVIIRIARSRSLLPQVDRVLALARWLKRHSVPAVVPADIDQPLPIEESDHVVTFWNYIPTTPPKPSSAELAAPLRRLHSLSPPPFELPHFAPIDTGRMRIDLHGSALDPAQYEWFADRLDQLEEELSSLEYALPQSVIHGDAYVGNLLRAPEGHIVLCDLDGMCIGPPEWDLIPELVAAVRYGRPGYQQLVEAYGFDPRSWVGAAVLQSVREIMVLTGVLPVLDSSPGIRSEFNQRLASLMDGTDGLASWTPFASAA